MDQVVSRSKLHLVASNPFQIGTPTAPAMQYADTKVN